MGMVHVPAGMFWRGCKPGKDPKCSPCKRSIDWTCGDPPGDVYLEEYYLDRTEVTVAEYAACVEAKRCTPPASGEFCKPDVFNWDKPDRRDHPVTCVVEEQAAAYCAYRGKHLPTALQFEKAIRGTDGRPFPWGDALPTCDRAILSDSGGPGCGRSSTSPVGSKPDGASPYGAVDVIGNVMELVTFDDGRLTQGPRCPKVRG